MTSSRTTGAGGPIVPMAMESMIPRETHQFTWNIADFLEVKNSKELVDALNVTFDMGSSVGLPVTFRAYLRMQDKEGERWIGLFLQLVKTPGGAKELMAKPAIKIGNLGKKAGEAKKYELGHCGWGWSDVIRRNEDVTNLPLDANGRLPIEITITLYNTHWIKVTTEVTISDVLKMGRLQERFARKLSENLEILYKDPTALTTSETPAVVSVVSKDGRMIRANSAMLAARSPVFRTMFQTPMTEVKEGVVKMEDIGGEALEVFLHFLHTATLKDNWKEPDVLEEFTYVAHKYLMQDLLEFLDEAIGLVCVPVNCLNMLRLARRLELKKATEALLKMYQDQWKHATGMEEMIQLLQE